jgi:hypothetical protein
LASFKPGRWFGLIFFRGVEATNQTLLHQLVSSMKMMKLEQLWALIGPAAYHAAGIIMDALQKNQQRIYPNGHLKNNI